MFVWGYSENLIDGGGDLSWCQVLVGPCAGGEVYVAGVAQCVHLMMMMMIVVMVMMTMIMVMVMISGLPRTQLGGGVAGLAVPSCIHSWLRWEPAGSSLPTSLYHRHLSQHHDLTLKSIV